MIADLYWLAGLLEGEGSFQAPTERCHYPTIALAMTDEDVVARACKMMGEQKYHRSERGKDRGWKPCFTFRIRGMPAIIWMKKLKPMMGERRQSQIDTAITLYNPVPVKRMTEAQKRYILLSPLGLRKLSKETGFSRASIQQFRRRMET